MKVQLHVNLKTDSGRTMLAGTYDMKESEFPEKVQSEIQHHRKGTQPKTTLTILEDDKPAKKKRQTRKKTT